MQGLCSKLSYSLFFPPFFFLLPYGSREEYTVREIKPPPPPPAQREQREKSSRTKTRGGPGVFFFWSCGVFPFAFFTPPLPLFLAFTISTSRLFRLYKIKGCSAAIHDIYFYLQSSLDRNKKKGVWGGGGREIEIESGYWEGYQVPYIQNAMIPLLI